jgi:hypothetical protein
MICLTSIFIALSQIQGYGFRKSEAIQGMSLAAMGRSSQGFGPEVTRQLRE